MKCDFCGKVERKMKTRRNFTHGRKSKGVRTNTCKSCDVSKQEGVKDGK